MFQRKTRQKRTNLMMSIFLKKTERKGRMEMKKGMMAMMVRRLKIQKKKVSSRETTTTIRSFDCLYNSFDFKFWKNRRTFHLTVVHDIIIAGASTSLSQTYEFRVLSSAFRFVQPLPRFPYTLARIIGRKDIDSSPAEV
jgi:hypothetical protein